MSQSLGAVAVGMGCDRGTPLATLVHALDQALAGVGASRAQVKACASISLKADEPAMLALGLQEGWVITFYEPAQLARVTVPNPSETVLRYMGTPSVSEAAALLAAGADMTALLVEKHKWRGADGKNATVSIARVPASLAVPVSVSPC